MNFRKTYDFFRNQIILINCDLQQYKTVFLEAPGNQMIREKAGGFFFERFYDIFWNHLTLLLSKLTDERYPFGEPKEISKNPTRENLVFETLISMAAEQGLRNIAQVNSYYEEAKHLLSDFRDARNKIFAHLDREWAEKKVSLTLYLSKAEAIIKNLENILKTISMECFENGENLQPSLSDDAFRLFFVLREGLILEKLQDVGSLLFPENNPIFNDIPPIEKPRSRESK